MTRATTIDGAAYTVVDMHTAGEPVRIFAGGMPDPAGATILAKRRDAQARLDDVRRSLMFEPRGHANMYGAWPVTPDDPEAAYAVLFTHCEGYSTMCGHATIALARYVVDEGHIPAIAPRTDFVLQCPCGPVSVSVNVDASGATGRASFVSVPAFVERLDATLEVPDFGEVTVDIAYGGAFYAIVPASRLGLDLARAPYETLQAAAGAVTRAGRAQLAIEHRAEPDLAFLYGTILTDDTPADHPRPSANFCAFGGGQVDRSPTGSGVTARMALDHARGRILAGAARSFRGPSGDVFEAEIVEATSRGVRIRVAGRAYYTGRHSFVAEPGDPFAAGIDLEHRMFADEGT